MEVRKTTIGSVTQTFEDGKCTNQEFRAADGVDYEDRFGDVLPPEKVDVFQKSERYQPFDMVQPGRDYYVFNIVGCVEPVINGPFDTKEEQKKCYDELMAAYGDSENTYFLMDVTKGATIEL